MREVIRKRDDKTAIQVLIGSIIHAPVRTYEENGTRYVVLPCGDLKNLEFALWRRDFFKHWPNVEFTEAEFALTLPLPGYIVDELPELQDNFTKLFDRIELLALSVWFMERGEVHFNPDSTKITLGVSSFLSQFVTPRVTEIFAAKLKPYGVEDVSYDVIKGYFVLTNAEKLYSFLLPLTIPSKRYLWGKFLLEMHDVSKMPSSTPIEIQKVGIRNVPLSLEVYTKAGAQRTIARASIYTNLSPEVMGSHLSRLLEVLNLVSDNPITSERQLLHNYLTYLRTRLHSREAHLKLRFPILLDQLAPVSEIPSAIRYECTLIGELTKGKPKIYKKIKVPYLSACICSKSISQFNAHCQRSFAEITVLLDGDDVPFESLIECVELSCSAPIRGILKREDEKYITEKGYQHAGFVESIARLIADRLTNLSVRGWSVLSTHEESLHQHDAIAVIRGGNEYVY